MSTGTVCQFPCPSVCKSVSCRQIFCIQNQFRDADNTGHSHDDDQSLNRFFKKWDTTNKNAVWSHYKTTHLPFVVMLLKWRFHKHEIKCDCDKQIWRTKVHADTSCSAFSHRLSWDFCQTQPNVLFTMRSGKLQRMGAVKSGKSGSVSGIIFSSVGRG